MNLPIDALLPEIVATIRAGNHLVIEAPPGAGKTTRVPPALLPHVRGEIFVLEPRRLAARLAARRVASDLGERAGETVGYQVRFEDVAGPRTRLKFLTEGVLTRRLLADPGLRGTGLVILDEFHERHLDGDLALALLKRSGMRVVVMSATLDAGPIARYLENCPVLRSQGKLHPLRIEYTPHSAIPIEEQVAGALERLIKEGLDGDVLVFLPGIAEIRRASRILEPTAARAGLLVVPLHGDLSTTEQDRAVAPAKHRKVILSTNVAESSVTIEGVTAVIDSGLARVAVDSPWTGLPSLDVRRISQSSGVQRAGRAGRTGPGRVIRLYTAEDFHRRPMADTPEILRRELSQLVVQMRAMGAESMDWLTPPPEAAITAANALLDRLEVTAATARKMAELPLPPRLAKLVIEASRLGLPEKGCAVAAVLSAGERGSSDLLTLAESDWQPQTHRVFEQIRRSFPVRDVRGSEASRSAASDDERILQAVFAAFPDRVARRRRDGEVLLCSGGSARFPECRSEFLVAIDIEERRDRGLPLVRLASPAQPEWLLEHAAERTTLEWNRTAERVEQVTMLLYDQLVIEETRVPAPGDEATARLLAEKALETDIGRFADCDELAQLKARAAFAGAEIDVAEALARLCRGRSSFAELISNGGLLAALRPPRLDAIAPERLRLPAGRQVRVHYEEGKPPWIESRLQDFFGVRETPRIGTVPVVVHLLAPNHRPVQVTTDLAGFWERLYPQVRRELSRKYPKHQWPEKP